MQRKHILLTALLLGVSPLFFVDLNRWFGNGPQELDAFAHVGIFGVLTLLLMDLPLFQKQKVYRRAAKVLVIVLIIGVCIELIQSLFGRFPQLSDVRQDLVGAFAGTSVFVAKGIPRLSTMGIAAALLIVELAGPGTSLWDRVLARIQFPVLGDFETCFECGRWSTGVQDHSVARTGHHSLRINLKPGHYAGTTLLRSFGDWSGYNSLELSIYNPDSASLPIVVSIRDHEHFVRGGAYDDRYNGNFVLEHSWNDLRIAMADIRNAPAGREMNLSDLAELVIFTVDLQQPQVLFLDHVRLSLK